MSSRTTPRSSAFLIALAFVLAYAGIAGSFLAGSWIMKFSGWGPLLKRLAQAVHGRLPKRSGRRRPVGLRLEMETLESRVTPSGWGLARPHYLWVPLNPS